MWYHGGHDDSHVQLCPQSHDVCNKVGPVPDKVISHLLELVLNITQSINSVWRGSVETMDVVGRIVSAILRPPHHGDASKSDRVDNSFISTNEHEAPIVRIRPASGAHPWRTPGHVTDSTRSFLLFVSPMHRCGSHITPNRHELMHKRAHCVLVFDHLPQLCLGCDPVANDATADPTHDISLHGVTFALRFLEEQSVHEGPYLAVTPKTLHAHARGMTQHVLHPLGFTHRQQAVIIHVRQAHRQAQWQRFRKAPYSPERRWLLQNARPPHFRRSQGFRKVESLAFYIVASWGRLHATTRRDTREMICGNAQLHLDLILQILSATAVVGEDSQVCVSLAPEKQSGNRQRSTIPKRTLLQRCQTSKLHGRIQKKVCLWNATFNKLLLGFLSSCAHLLKKAIMKVVDRIVVFHFQRLAGGPLRYCVRPPSSQSCAKPEFTYFQPSAEDIMFHLDRLRFASCPCSRIQIISDEMHRETSHLHLGGGAHIHGVHSLALFLQVGCPLFRNKLSAPSFGSVLPAHLVFRQHIEQARIVPLVHRANRSIPTPRSESRQRLENSHNEPPAHLQALQHPAMSYIAPQHYHQSFFKMGWVPGHLYAWAHPLGQLETRTTKHFAIAITVFKQQATIRGDAFDSCRKHKVPTAIDGEALALLAGSFFLAPQRTQGLVLLCISAGRSPVRIHTVANAILTQRAHARKERTNVLREGDNVLAKLMQSRALYRDIAHLQVLEGHKHGLSERALHEQIT